MSADDGPGYARYDSDRTQNAGSSREPGTRRKRIANYLKAANDLRQTYQQTYKDSWMNRNGQGDGASEVPGAFPGAICATSGNEQLVIFPSYARRHIKQKPAARPGTIQETTGSGRDARDTAGTGDADFWQQEWDKYEDDNAVVDVDVRGWLYSPHHGALSRKNRLMVGLARQLSGIPAPRKSPTTSTTSSRSSSPSRLPDRLAAYALHHEEEQAAKAAEDIVKQGEAKAEIAKQGGYSEGPIDRQYDSGRMKASDHMRDSSQSRMRSRNHIADLPNTSVQKQTTWNNPSQLSQAELVEANEQMMKRLQPFLASPLAYTPISAFFYNESDSRQKTVETDAQGHFNFRAALDFVPTHVRILASDKLSVTEEVQVTEPHGVSVISDIDDTIKHSAISLGAREIFRNVFIRHVSDLSIQGVQKWYNGLAEVGCTFHYVSNSPWQMYPLLTSFFSTAGLPPGSFHLKKYSGVFQGIFEPVAERKRGTLERILMDFPERRFVLVGDSGEADLEVYTEFVCENPGRVLGVFIRDVTTTAKPGFFDPISAPDHTQKAPPSIPNTIREDWKLSENQYTSSPGEETDDDLKEAMRRSLADKQESQRLGDGENLINFETDDEQPSVGHDQRTSTLQKSWLQPPPRPAKPRNLSGHSLEKSPKATKSPPPQPRKPSTSIGVSSPSDRSLVMSNLELPQSIDNTFSTTPRPPVPPPRGSYRAAARSKLDSAYAKLPSPTSLVFGSRSSSHSRDNSVDKEDSRRDVTRSEHNGAPPIPPRKPFSYTSSAAQSIHNKYNAIRHSQSTESMSGYGSDGTNGERMRSGPLFSEIPVSKKEEAWTRRWQRAQAILDRRGVVLKSWRVGDDVRFLSVELVEKAIRQVGPRGAEQWGM